MKKLMGYLLLITLLASFILTGCGNSEIKQSTSTTPSDENDETDETDEKTTLKLFHNWINVDETSYFEDLAKEFEASHKNVDIIIENVGDPDYKSKLKVMLGADDAPDIFFSWSGESAYKFVRAGSVLDLSEYLDKDSEWADTFIPASLVPFTYEEGLYGIPVRIDCKMMVYNKDLFEKYNVEVPKTYEELLEICQTFKDAKVLPIALGNQDPWASCHYITTFNGQCVPEDVRNSDYNYKTGKFTDKGYLDALYLLKDINDKGYFTPNTNAIEFEVARNDFLTGNAAMTYMQSIEFKRCSENNINAGVFPMPAPENAKGNTNLITGSPDGFMISKSCKNPDVAIELLKLITSNKWQERMITQLSSPASIKDVHNESNSDEVTLEAVKLYSTADGFVNWLDADVHSKIAEVYVPGIQEVLAGTTTPEKLMEKVQKAADEIQTEGEE
ncbi:MAG: sugar ABC transporter substrate-binding protein [Herbinix sp.]|nr:sugar ABC transporter substrate-binding protein [Herbinix sp.]